MNKVSVPLERFITVLTNAGEWDRHHSLDQVGWLLDHFSFDDHLATYLTDQKKEEGNNGIISSAI